MNLHVFALLLDTLGTLMIAFAALRVHHRVLNEHKVDEKVFADMQREQLVGLVGVCLVICGFIVDFVLLSN